MASRANKNDVDVQVDEINNDVTQLADTLEDVLKSFGSDAKDEVDAARKKAEALLKETRARLNGSQGRVTQAARDAAGCADSYVRDKPWQSVGIGAAVGIVIGALLVSRR
ncbi:MULTISPECIES: DUF883 family protein [Cedecea]|uniref:DUF883 domain-containing protein n=2 Tax=Cedecea davisae TaxID=158484 RepID=S3IR25_9ENTR|nr:MULTISPECIES: DUF883 family protein [Cedecea]EPF15021.1 putative protein ElaB [Cedecea davisae DSM 4568]MBU4680561.1 DUF883 family protein [Cedecea davisae]MBU4685775.1 DUF883 family protein [Cedecea davisae]QIX96569.1 DUF883 family protein [Cedecea sp. FDAARGOS_727]SUX37985.1 Bacterial protein of uncharacterised function (DUF883) [Cedecea davisae]